MLQDSTRSTLHITRKTTPITFPITLDEVKLFLRIQNNYDDNLIKNLISMASEYAQWYMERSLSVQKWQVSYSGYMPGRVHLIFGPVIKVDYVKIIHLNGNETLISKENYYVDLVQSHIRFNQRYNVYRMDIVYDAGYEDVNLIPAQIKQGIMHHVAVGYKNRESENMDNLAFIKEIYLPFRELKLVL